MFAHEFATLSTVARKLRERFPARLVSVHAFGSRVRGDHGEWSDFDILVVVKDRDPEIEDGIAAVFVEEELRSNLFFALVINDLRSFSREKELGTPFYETIISEGVAL